MKTLLILLLTVSCTRLKERRAQVAAWTGRDIAEVRAHPKYKHMRPREKDGKLIFADGTPVITGTRCQGLGGCPTADQFWCEHIFTLKENKITHYEQYGPCPYRNELDPIEGSGR